VVSYSLQQQLLTHAPGNSSDSIKTPKQARLACLGQTTNPASPKQRQLEGSIKLEVLNMQQRAASA
jgi:hypothetical protein